MMKRLVLTVALAGISGGAFAADLRGPIIEAPPPLPLPAPAFSWTGAYAGVNVGIGESHTNYNYNVNNYNEAYNNYPGAEGSPNYGLWNDCPCNPAPAPYYAVGGNSASGSEKLRGGGVLGGVQVGYNYALNNFGGFGGHHGYGGHPSFTPVLGIEADFDGSGINNGGALSQFAQGFPAGYPNYVGVESDIKYFGTVRGRLGVAFDRLLVFGTGGFAYADTSASINSPAYGVSYHSDNFHTGVAYGGGFEFALTNNLLLRAEYLHLDLNSKAIVVNGVTNGTATFNAYEKPSLDLVRAGLSYKLDFAQPIAPPVIARY